MVDPDHASRLLAENKDLRERLRKVSGPPTGGPDDPDVGTLLKRVAELTDTVGKIEDRLRGVEVAFASANAKIDGLGNRFDDLGRRLDDLGRRMDDVTRRFDSAVTTAIGRVPSWWQMPAVIAATVALLTALFAGAKHFRLLG